MARAGSADVLIFADFTPLKRQVAAEMRKLGRENIHVGVDVDTSDLRGFKGVVREARAEAEHPIVQTLAADFDSGGYERWTAANQQAERETKARKIEQEIGLEVDQGSVTEALAEVKAVRKQAARIDEIIRLRVGAQADDASIAAVRKKVEAKVGAIRVDPIKAKAEFDLDEASYAVVKTAIEDIDHEARGIRRIKAEFNVDTSTARSAFRSLNRENIKTQRNLDGTTRAAHGTTGALGGLGKAASGAFGRTFKFSTRIPIVGLVTMGKVAYDAAGGLISLAGALAPLSGLLGAIGPLALSAAQGLGTIKLATSGVSDAISAAFTEQDKAAVSSSASLKQQTASVEAVREANLSLASAQRTAKGAQEDLNQARSDATREIEDMRASLRQLSLDEEGASLSLKEAKQALRDLTAQGAGDLEIERASLRIREARAELQKTRTESKRTRDDLGKAEAGGVKGMPQVVQARQSLADANRAVAEAERELANATKASTEAMGGGGAAADAFQQKLAKLPPAAQRFVKFIVGLRPEIKKLQGIAAQGLFPGVEQGIRAATVNLPVLEKIVGRTSKAFGDLAKQAGQRLGSKEWGKDLEVQGARNEVTIRRLGTAGLNLAEAFKDVSLAAGPLVDRLTKWVGVLTEGWKESAKSAEGQRKLTAFFKDAGDTFFKTKNILADLAVSFKNIGSAARGAFGNELLDNIATGAKNLREWTGTKEGQKELVAIFEDIGDSLKKAGRFVRDLVGDFRDMKAQGKTTGEALGNIFSDVIVGAIERAFNAGPRIAQALVRGFLQADIWGKLIGGAFLFSRAGGLAGWKALFRKQGAVAGAAMGTGIAEGATAGVVGGGVVGGAAGGGLIGRIGKRVLPVAKRVGLIGVGLVLAENVMNEFDRQVAKRSADPFEALKAQTSGGLKVPVLGNLTQQSKKLFGLGPLPDQFSDAEKAAKKLEPVLRAIAEQSKAISPDKARELRDQIAQLTDASAEAKRRMGDIVDRGEELGKLKAEFGITVDVNTPLGEMKKLEVGFNRLQNRLAGDAEGIAKVSAANLDRILKLPGLSSREMRRDVSKNMRLTTNAISESLFDGQSSATKALKAIRHAFVIHTAAAKDTAKKNFDLAADAIHFAINTGEITAKRGLREIRRLFKSYLATFGIKGRAAEIYMLDVPKSSGGGGQKTPTGTRSPMQRGGLITVPGIGTGDKVPGRVPVGTGVINRKAANVMLEPGEKLVPPKIVKKMGGPKAIHAINRAVPRFAQGGIVALGRKLQKEGYEVGEHPAFGGVAPVHATNSYHYKGMAIDINDDVAPFASGGGEPGSLDKLFARLKRLPGVLELLWRVKDHFDHLHLAMGGGGGPLGDFTAQIQKIGRIKLGGPDSALKAGAQAGLDRSRQAANLALEQAAMSPEGAEPGVHLPGGAGSKANRTLGRRMAARYGWIGPEWGALDDLWGRLEGSWDENLANLEGSGAYGIAQALPSSKYPPAGRPDAPPGIKKAQAQIGWGLRYIKERYGDPLAAHAFRLANNYYAKGGVVGYVGDSLGVGTAPYLKGRVGKLVAKVLEGRQSPAGIGVLKGMLGDRFDRYVLDLGTNDPDAGTLTRSLKKADKLTDARLLMVPTVNGPKAQAKNAAIRGLAGRDDIDLFEWAKRSKGLVGPDGIHAETGADYSKRAAMLAGALKAATRKHDRKVPKGAAKLSGTLTHKLRQTLGSKKPKTVDKLVRQIKKLGLPKKWIDQIGRLGKDHERFADFAASAQLISPDDGPGAVINGLNETGWLTKDLEAQFKMRNLLVKARDFVVRRRDSVDRAFTLARTRLDDLVKPARVPHGWKGLNPATGKVAEWNKQPAAKRKARKREWRAKGGHLPGDRHFDDRTAKLTEVSGARKKALRKLVPALKLQKSILQGGLGSEDNPDRILGGLFELQGHGPPGLLRSPWPIGTVFGGSILQTQKDLVTLGAKPDVTDSATAEKDTERADLLAQLLREANLRTAVSERQFDVLRNFPPFGGQFATGGVVPGPQGAPRTIVAHGGETITPPGGGSNDVQVLVYGDIVSTRRDPVEVVLGDRRFKAAVKNVRAGGRPMPGRTGGGL